MARSSLLDYVNLTCMRAVNRQPRLPREGLVETDSMIQCARMFGNWIICKMIRFASCNHAAKSPLTRNTAILNANTNHLRCCSFSASISLEIKTPQKPCLHNANTQRHSNSLMVHPKLHIRLNTVRLQFKTNSLLHSNFLNILFCNTSKAWRRHQFKNEHCSSHVQCVLKHVSSECQIGFTWITKKCIP